MRSGISILKNEFVESRKHIKKHKPKLLAMFIISTSWCLASQDSCVISRCYCKVISY